MMNLLFGATAIFYVVGCWNSFRYYRSLETVFDNRAAQALSGGLFLQLVSLIGLWVSQGYAPFTTVEGILMTLSFSLGAGLLLGRLKAVVPILTSLFLPLIFFLSFLAFLIGLKSLPVMDSHLMSAGMASHIFLTFLGFAHFTLGFGVGVAFWIQEGQLKQHQIKSWSYRLPALEILDNLTIFYVGLGFVFWMGGLLLGAVQAYQVWNRLPLLDPKILGSFLVLVIYAFFFLLRWVFGMRGKKTMMLVMAGYFLALFTFLGVRVFLTTQHTF